MPTYDLAEFKQHIAEAAAYIRERHPAAVRVGVICGTGMGSLADQVDNRTVLSYRDIPHFPVSTVESHSGNLMLGQLGGQPVVVMQGRFHYYEGYTMQQVTFPVRVMKALGCTHLIVMNAVGSMNPLIGRGSIVLVRDHVNLMGDNPLIGPNDDTMGPRFPDMSQPYCPELAALAREVALEARLALAEGVLVGVAGPNLETRAEYRMFQMLGIDLVTMSTIPEVIVANHAGLRVLTLSTVTDQCLPDALEPAKLEDIIAVARAAEPRLQTLVTGVLTKLAQASGLH